MIETFLLPILAAVTAGVAWNSFGIYSNWKKTGSLEINGKKLLKNIIIGIVVGIVAYGFQVTTDETAIIAISTGNMFFAAVGAWFPIIIVVEKLFLRRQNEIENKPGTG